MKQSAVLCGLAASLLLTALSLGCDLTNEVPVIHSFESDRDWVYAGDSTSIECLASDPDEDEISYQWSANGGTISGEGSSVSWAAPNGSGMYTVTVSVSDLNGGYATASLSVDVRLNEPPIIEALSAELSLVRFGDGVAIECLASDPDGDKISYQWSANGGAISGQGSNVIWTAPDSTGSYTTTVTVRDARGGEATSSVVVNVRLNDPPIIEGFSAEATSIRRGDSTAIECLASDPDGDEISYRWSADDGAISGKGSNVTWTAPDTAGSYAITVRVSDSRDSVASAELLLDVPENALPVIDSLKAEETTVLVGKSTIIRCDASDPDGDELTYSWEASGGELSGEGEEVSWIALGQCGDLVTITVTVSDDQGGEKSKQVTVEVRKPG